MLKLVCLLLAVCVLCCQIQISRVYKRLKLLDALAEEVCEISDDFYGPERER